MLENTPEFDAMRGKHAEAHRLATLAALDILDTPSEQAFDTIVESTQRLLGCKIVLISLIDETRQWFKAKRGLDVAQTPREHAFCAHAVLADDILVVPDATADDRFAANPLVTGAPHIRFYAGVPIRAKAPGAYDGALPMGTLCVIDDKPRCLTEDDIRILQSLAQLVETLLEARGAVLAVRKVADERQCALDKLNRTYRQFRQAERMANIGSWRLTLADNHVEWSEQTFAIHGLAVAGGPPLDTALDFYPAHARSLISTAIARTIEAGEPYTLETDFITAQGDHRRVRSMGELELKDGVPVALIGVFQDITNRYVMEQALRQTAYTDDLTRIASRGRFNQFVDEQIAAAKEREAPLALLLIDLDHFKAVNDQCGHAAGDDLLRLIASRLQAPYLESSFAARLGGDEFVLLVTCRQALSDLKGLLRQLLADLRHSIGTSGPMIHVSATIGACWLDGDVQSRSDLLLRADTALYRAKQTQRGTAMISGQEQLISVGQGRAPPALRLVR